MTDELLTIVENKLLTLNQRFNGLKTDLDLVEDWYASQFDSALFPAIYEILGFIGGTFEEINSRLPVYTQSYVKSDVDDSLEEGNDNFYSPPQELLGKLDQTIGYMELAVTGLQKEISKDKLRELYNGMDGFHNQFHRVNFYLQDSLGINPKEVAQVVDLQNVKAGYVKIKGVDVKGAGYGTSAVSIKDSTFTGGIEIDGVKVDNS